MRIAAKCLTLVLSLAVFLAVAGDVVWADPSGSDADHVRATAGPLNQLVLNVAPQQVVGHPLVTTAQIFLLDDSSSPVVDYDLSAHPITLSSSSGTLSPAVIDDSSLFSEGIIDFLSLGVTYDGLSGPIEMTAFNSGVVSLGEVVVFNGYDILETFDIHGDPVSAIYAGLPTAIEVAVANGGGLTAITQPNLKAFFASGGGSLKLFFTPRTDGVSDTLLMDLPTSALSPGPDTLILVLESIYRPADSQLVVHDTMRVPVEVLPQAEVRFVDGTLKPDSVHSGALFDVSFDIAATGFSGPIDETDLAIRLLSTDDSVLAVLLDSNVAYDSFESDTIHYAGIEGVVDSSLDLAPGWYRLGFEYRLISGGSVFTLPELPVDSLYLLPGVRLTYVEGSFTPDLVASGQETYFEFDLLVDGTEPVLVDPSRSSFQVAGSGFSTTTNLIISEDTLVVGSNRIETEHIFIPEDQVGAQLSVAASIFYHHRGAANALTFTTSFGDQLVNVEELPIVQIVEVSVRSVNSPKVNTWQPFQIVCRIANLSTSDMSPFDIRMVSDGNSTFESDMTVPGVPGEDTVEVLFDVTASGTANPAEIFWIDITTLGVSQLPPVDNIALANIQEAAMLSLSHVLLGAEQGYVSIGAEFSIVITILNAGEAAAGSAVFEITTHGMDLGVEDPLTGIVDVGEPRGISFTAPMYDTTVRIGFALIDKPLDLNTNLPAYITDTAFEITLPVTSPQVVLYAEGRVVSSNLVLPSGERDLFELVLINPGASSIADTKLESLVLSFVDRSDQPLSVRSVLEAGTAGLYDDGLKVATATVGADQLRLIFNDYVVAAGDTARVSFRARVKAEGSEEFGIRFDTDDLVASFASGPLAGEPVQVVSEDDAGWVLNEVYTTVPATLKGSFTIRNNPFNPVEEPAEFNYYLPQASAVKFRVLTLTGEEVYRLDLALGDPGTAPGLQSVFWNGRDNESDMVLNGVYVAVIEALGGDDKAILKVAVLK